MIERFRSVTVVVLGDVILDEYLHGRVSRLSPEAPVPVLEVVSRHDSLGGAGNVARNIAALGGVAKLFAVVGSDHGAERIRALAGEAGIDVNGLMADPARPTSVKQRVLSQTQQIVRIDSESVAPLAPELVARTAARIEEAAAAADVLVISDYDKGVLTAELLERAVQAFRVAGKPVVVDPNVVHFFRYGATTVVTPNHLQLERVSGRRIRSEDELFATAREIRSRLGPAALLVTRGEEGMALIEDAGLTLIPTVAREVYDVTGAGDTVVAVLALGLGAGLGLAAAARVANAAAGIVVGKRGTAVVLPDELERRLAELRLQAGA